MIVIDNSAFSALWRVKSLSLLSALFSQIIIPVNVYIEFTNKWGDQNFTNNFIKLDTISPTTEKLHNNEIYNSLGSGEKDAIAYCIQNKLTLLSDDLQVRKLCKEFEITVIGVLGVCKLGYQKNYFQSKFQYIQFIDEIAKDLYLSQSLVKWAKNV